MANILIIGLGAITRYGAAIWIGQRWGRSFPLGTFVINSRSRSWDSEEMIKSIMAEITSVVGKGLIEVSDTIVIKCCERKT